MAGIDNGALVKGLYDAFNRRDLGKAAEVTSPDCRWTQVPFGTTSRGSNALSGEMQGWLDAFPDGRADVQNVIAGGEYVCCEFIGRGTHTGTLKGPGGSIAPTGKRVELQMCEVYCVRNGKIVEGRSYFDAASLMKQLGVED